MNSKRAWFWLLPALVFVLGVAIRAVVVGKAEKPAKADQSSSAMVTLASRTFCATGFPVRFCEHQTVSARGTAPYVVALTNGASKAEAIGIVRSCGARVIGPLPPNALLIETSVFSLGKLSQVALFAAASEWLPADKVDARLKPLLDSGAATLDITVVALAPADVEGLASYVAEQGGERLKGCLNGNSSVTLKLPRTLVEELVKRGDVRWLEPFVRPKPLNDQAVVPAAMNVQPVWNAHGLTGAGQLVTTSDTGIDTGDLTTMHADLRNQLAGFKVARNFCYTYDADGHGTHTAGSIVGDGTMSDGQIRGVAYGARLWAWFCAGTYIDKYGKEQIGIYTPEDCGELFRPSGATNACIHSASWGSDEKGVYTSQCANMDKYVWEHPDFLPVIANGNEGSSAKTVDSPASAKNVLSVGATQNARSGGDNGVWGNGDPTKLAVFSSRGPCADGRIKPDVCAPGVGIVSTRSYAASYFYGLYANTNYAYDCGTSMATPLTAGAAALVRQWLVERRGFTNAVPTAALVKAVLTGGAKNVVAPNNDFGWGCVDLGESLYPSNRAVKLIDRVPFSNGIDNVACEVTLTNSAPFDVQLVWIDYPKTEGASPTLVNDLDLIVSNKTTDVVWYGNGTSSGDHTNTVESVRIASATPGDYAVIVRGYDVSYGSTCGGAAAVYLRGAFEGEEEPQVLEIDAEPSAANVAMSVGETNVFSVTIVSPTNVTPSFAWTVDGVAVTGATSNRFVYGTTWADHGRHVIRVVVTASGGLSAERVWSVAVCGEVSVDAATGDDATATGSPEQPYATIAAALAKTIEGDALRVGRGVYAGGLIVPANAVRIEAIEGPEATVIDGGGTNRCFDASSCPTTILSGFTLTNGWVDATVYYNYGAGVLYGVLTNCVIRCCWIEGEYAYGGGAAGTELIDCVVENCCADWVGGGLYGCTASYCLIRGNGTYFSGSYGGGAVASELTHCTVFDNVSGKSAGGVDGDCTCTNSIVWGNFLFNGEMSNWESYDSYGTTYCTAFAFSCTTPTGYTDLGGDTNAAPRWVNAEKGDFRLVVKSPCLGTADDGLNMGAWQGEPVPGYVITAMADGPGEVTPSEVFVAEGEQAEFTATQHHPFFGWMTNGVFAANASTNVFTWADVYADGTIVASFGMTNFYVDAVCGNDDSNGWSWVEAKRTIQAAVDVAASGETVSVNPGVYTGEVDATAAKIDIVAVEGPEKTVILGDGTNRCYVGSYNSTTMLRGFALDGGVSAENYGGGVLYGTLSNCVIRNCFAKSGGGGACAATLIDCVISDCETDGQGGGAYASTLVNCTVRGNVAGTWRSEYFDYQCYSREGNLDFGGGIDCQCLSTNSIIWGNFRKDGTSDNWEDCVFVYWWSSYEVTPDMNWTCTTPACLYGANNITVDPRFVTTNDFSDARIYEISPCIGSGYGGVNIGAYRGAGVVKALPAIDVKTATGEEVSNAVASVGYVDKAVEKGIGTNGTTYAAFQTWSTNGLKSTAVVFSTRAYDSFLVRGIVAAPTLLGEGNETTVELTALEPASDGTCSTMLRLMDGETAISLCFAKEAFAKHAQVGDDLTALAPADASNVKATSVDDGRGAVKLTIKPPSQTLRYFMRFVIR